MKPQHAIAVVFAVTFAAAALAVPVAGRAAEDTPLTSAECKQRYQSCQADCDAKHPDDEIKRGACLPVCSARYAACDARAAYERAKPWLEDKTKKTKEYLDDLMKDPPAEKEKKAPPPEMPDTTRT